MKFIVVTGGVISGLGKGITASSIGLLLKEKDYNVTSIKVDPYLNIDAGTMSPYEHGEVYVLNDGTETDLDLGNYERFLDIKLSREHNITSGKVFKRVLEEEREGKYIGQTVQYIPHVTNTIISMIKDASSIQVNDNKPDICIIELGGTIGDMENQPFIESLRQMNMVDKMCFVHVSLIVNTGEEKTKPTQHCVQELRKSGISPDIVVLRSNDMISNKTRNKIEMHCQVPLDCIFTNPNVGHIYQVPGLLRSQFITDKIERKLELTPRVSSLISLPDMSIGDNINIAIVGKYTENKDTYLSIHRALEHAAFSNNVSVTITYISSETNYSLTNYDGVIIPGGFGNRGIDGMINAAKYCRDKDIPLLGICLGMQVICIESIQTIDNTCYSSEFRNGGNNVIISINELDYTKLGGTMKLGLKETYIRDRNSHAYSIYNSQYAYERHRHRYEVNPKYINLLNQTGLIISGIDINGRVDIVEDPTKRFYLGCQYHPEYMNSLKNPSKLFVYFLEKCIRK